MYRIEQRISAKKRKVGFSTDSCWAYSKLRQESENSGANWFRQVRDLDFFRLLKKVTILYIMNFGYLRNFLQIYFICFIQKNDHSKLKKKKTASNNRIISLSWLFEIFVSKIIYNSPFTLKKRKWHIFNVILTSLIISSTCKSLAAAIKMKIWTEIESLKEVAQLGLESSISLMGKSVMNSAKLLNLCHELSSKQH